MLFFSKRPTIKSLMSVKPFVVFSLLAMCFQAFAKSSEVVAGEAQRWTTNMTEGVTATSHEIYDLHMLIFMICVWIGVVVFGVMFYSMIMHRKSAGAVPSKFHESTLVELAWTIIPAIILVAMAVPETSTLIKIYDTSDADIEYMNFH